MRRERNEKRWRNIERKVQKKVGQKRRYSFIREANRALFTEN